MINDNNFDINDKNAIVKDSCNVCPRGCNISRYDSIGYCKSKGLRIARYGLHYWEEPCISGKEGSGTIFFSGCALRCSYCQNYEVSQLSKGYNISVNDLINIFKELESLGANNINLVTPTHYIDYIIKALDIYKPKIPVCYNTSGYESIASLQRLSNYIDIFLVDFKYFDNDLALKLSKAQDYPQIAKSAIIKMRELIPQDIYNDKGIMVKGVIVRHLVLPNLIDNSKNIISWVKDNLGSNTVLSIMNQYTPFGKAVGDSVIGRKVKPIEYKIVVNHAIKCGFENSYIQEDSSADECFIPEFFGTIQNEE